MREAIRVKCLAQGHKEQMVPRPSVESGPPTPKSGTPPLHHRSPFFSWLVSVNDYGAAVIKNAPTRDDLLSEVSDHIKYQGDAVNHVFQAIYSQMCENV